MQKCDQNIYLNALKLQKHDRTLDKFGATAGELIFQWIPCHVRHGNQVPFRLSGRTG
jgi:hypothetical protein